MLINTKYSLEQKITYPNKMNGNALEQFTVEAIRLDKTGTSYLLCSPSKPFPDHETREWVKEKEITPQGRER